MRVLAEGAADTGPARLGCKINLRVKRDAYSDCEVLLSDDIRKLFDQFNIIDRGKSKSFTPLGKIHGSH